MQSDASAIGTVRNAARVTGFLEAVDHSGHGTGGQAGLDSELPSWESLAVFDDIQAAEVSLAHAESLGGEAVERVVLVATDPEFTDEPVDRWFL